MRASIVIPSHGTHAERGCYVQLTQAPLAIWRAAERGAYDDVHGVHESIRDVGAGHIIRLGAYGDPCALPIDVVRMLVSRSIGWTGYTHQWRSPRVARSRWRRLVMASCDSVDDMHEARAAGWRTFRHGRYALPEPGEITCPSELGTTCADCRLCDGTAVENYPRRFRRAYTYDVVRWPSNGAIVYHGPSMIDRAPIVGVVTGLRTPTRNTKTGPMIQLWIMPADRDPLAAAADGADASVCGACPLRPLLRKARAGGAS